MRKTGLFIAAVAIAVPGAFLAVKAAPEREAGGTLARLAAGKTFTPICDANGDTRPDPRWVGASFENDQCRAPPMPTPLDGFAVSREKLMAGIAAVQRYNAQSDAYQRCIRDFVVARRDGKERRPEVALVLIENHRVLASQRNQKKAASQISRAINDFNRYGSDCPG